MKHLSMLDKTQANPVLWASLGAVFMVFAWSGWIILSRAGVQSSLTPSDITMIRYGTATLFALPFSLRYDWKKVTLWKAVVVSLGCGFPYTMFSFYGLMSIKAANAGVIVNGLLPVFGVILAFLVLGERTTKRRLFAIGLILIANLIMMGHPQAVRDNWFGWLMLIGASLVFSSYMFLGKRYGFTSKDALAFLPIINAVLFLPIWWMSDSGISSTPISTIVLQAGYQGILVSIVTLLITFYALKHIGAMNLSIYFSFVPFVTAILAWPILHEHLSLSEIVGIVVCSVGLFFYAKK
ncbi:EamA-like transporter family protein [Reichenbachiella agariperforans]|uniref:EamA-like transporter family protein n=2 Tax=Reichenbachiellaceae TaxID=2762302 RepID=A0A1M6J224_REIAG|nr:EamA-like transporter family protein [Reichenbachiella agariperforans]